MSPAGRATVGSSGGEGQAPGIAAALVRESTARRFKALSHPVRLRIIDLLARGGRSVSELAELTSLPGDTVSKHLRVLASVNVVRRSQQGNFARYAVSDVDVRRLVAVGYRGVMREVERLQIVAELGEQYGAVEAHPDRRAEGVSSRVT